MDRKDDIRKRLQDHLHWLSNSHQSAQPEYLRISDLNNQDPEELIS